MITTSSSEFVSLVAHTLIIIPLCQTHFFNDFSNHKDVSC